MQSRVRSGSLMTVYLFVSMLQPHWVLQSNLYIWDVIYRSIEGDKDWIPNQGL